MSYGTLYYVRTGTVLLQRWSTAAGIVRPKFARSIRCDGSERYYYSGNEYDAVDRTNQRYDA